jgi:hypothetical protein
MMVMKRHCGLKIVWTMEWIERELVGGRLEIGMEFSG